MKLHDLNLIAIHIEKTGGMSFKRILRRQYKRKYYRMNIKPEVVDRQAALLRHLEAIPPDTRVIHGHFRYADALPLFQDYPQVPVITWLREPVARVISQYFFFKRKYQDGDQPEKTYMEDYSLMDFAKDARFQNGMSRSLAGAALDDLAFVGLMEYFEEDVAYLAALLNWGKHQVERVNTNLEFKSQFVPPTEQERKEIAKLNQDDVTLYQQALVLRHERPRVQSR